MLKSDRMAKTCLRITYWNCRSLSARKNTAELLACGADIICLQETKLNPDKEMMYASEWTKGPGFFNCVRGGKSGTAILFNTWQIDIKKFFE